VAEPAGPKGRKGRARRDGAGAGVGGPKLWAGRFDEATAAIVEAYTTSVRADARLVEHDIAASIAHARMLGRQGIISKRDADSIIRGLEEIREEWRRGDFALRAELEDVHMNVETRLAAKIGSAAGRLHTARSRNDQVATDFRLYTMDACAEAIRGLMRLQASLLDLADAHRDAIMPGYTHLQRAQPVLFAHHLLAYVEMLDRDARRFAFAHGMMDALPLGSGALAGAPYPLDRQSVADELAVSRVTANSIDAVSDRDFVADYVYAAALCMVHISRLAEELILWSSAEFGFIRLPDSFATGSSIMPQKKNPDVAELARGRSGRAIGALMAMLTTLKGLPLAYNRDLQEDKPTLFDAEDALLMTLDVLADMLPRIEVDEERMRTSAVANYSLATDLADYLVRKGLPFREAHEAVGNLVRHAETKGVELHELPLTDYRQASPLFEEDARRIDAKASVRSRDVVGGTAPRRVHAELRRARKRLAAYVMATPGPKPSRPSRSAAAKSKKSRKSAKS
jgi:argininosuccinate lyase